eukprot:TRINITY_DN6225_c0_g1_i1.p1 TRINITY_DN6225_c0_g1~~TRINITY_DN6225_c0_g1_i1.p1  ORF type:complete len:480 (+),score=114.79 TRINITY_DN6225_c0_g1_i1:65-1504(+)
MTQSALRFWEDFSFDDFVSLMDRSGEDITQRQSTTNLSRQSLVDVNKQYKNKEIKLSDLMKAYQEHIELLTERAVFTEGIFFKVYEMFSDGSDPLKAIQYARRDEGEKYVREIQTLEDANEELSKTVDKMKEELQEVNDQEVTIRELESKISRMEQQKNEQVLADIEKTKADLYEQLQEKEITFSRKEKELNTEIEHLKKSHSDVLANYVELEQKLEETHSSYNKEKEASKSEITMLANEVDRLVKINTHLKRELENAAKSSNVEDITHIEMLVAKKDVTINTLREDIVKLETKISHLDSKKKSEMEKLQDSLILEKENNTELETLLEERTKQCNELKARVVEFEDALEKREDAPDSNNMSKTHQKALFSIMTERDNLRVKVQQLDMEKEERENKVLVLHQQISNLKDQLQYYDLTGARSEDPGHSSRPIQQEELNSFEKILYSTLRIFLKNRMTRLFLFFYIISLHLLVGVTISFWES